MRHDSAFHLAFYENLAHAALGSSGKGGKGKGGGDWGSMMMQSLFSEWGMPMPGGMGSMGSMGSMGKAGKGGKGKPAADLGDPMKANLVKAVKQYQASSMEQKQLW